MKDTMKIIGCIGAICCGYTAINVFINGAQPLSAYSAICGAGFVALGLATIQRSWS